MTRAATTHFPADAAAASSDDAHADAADAGDAADAADDRENSIKKTERRPLLILTASPDTENHSLGHTIAIVMAVSS